MKSKKPCSCEWCTVTSPMISRIRDALPDELKKDFDYIVVRMMSAEEDADVANCKLNGNWPGWERNGNTITYEKHD